MVQQLRKSITGLIFFLISAAALGAAGRAIHRAARPQAGRAGPLRRSPRRHPLGHLRPLHRLAVALARALGPEQGTDPEPPPDLPRLRDPARPRSRPPDHRRSRERRAPARTRPPAYPWHRANHRAERRADQPSTTPGTTPGTVRLGPRVRAEGLAKEMIPSIPAAAIEPFLTRPLVVEPDGLDKAPTIVGTQADRVILAAGNSAYVRGIGNSKDGTWYIYRRGDALVDPDTNEDACLRGDLPWYCAAQAPWRPCDGGPDQRGAGSRSPATSSSPRLRYSLSTTLRMRPTSS